jgi:hypothetical protein
VKTTATLITLHELADLPHLPIVTNPVDSRNQILLTSQLSAQTTSEICLYANISFGHLRNNSRTYTKQTELFVVHVPSIFCCIYFFHSINFNITIFLSLVLSPSISCLFLHYNSLFSSQLLFLPLLFTLSPVFTSSSYPPSTSHHTTPPSYTLTTH